MTKISLETSKLLKEVGFPQKEMKFAYVDGELEHCPSPMEWPIACPTSDEILELLPSGLNVDRILGIHIWHYGNPRMYAVQYRPSDYRTTKDLSWCRPFEAITSLSLPEALAAMWIYLRQEKLI